MDAGSPEPAEILGETIVADDEVRRASHIEIDRETMVFIERRLEAGREPISRFFELSLGEREGVESFCGPGWRIFKPHRDWARVASWPGAARRRIALVIFLGSSREVDPAGCSREASCGSSQTTTPSAMSNHEQERSRPSLPQGSTRSRPFATASATRSSIGTSEGARVRGCEGARVRGCEGARVRGCEGARVRGCDAVRGCDGCEGATCDDVMRCERCEGECGVVTSWCDGDWAVDVPMRRVQCTMSVDCVHGHCPNLVPHRRASALAVRRHPRTVAPSHPAPSHPRTLAPSHHLWP